MSEEADAGSPEAASFSFRSKWQLAAPRAEVWEALNDFKGWVDWWPGLEEIVETSPGDAEGIGQTATSRWRGPIGYLFRFSIEAVERREPDYLRGLASGDLSGEGSWALSEYAGWTGVQLDWKVHANRKWMEFLAPVARPIFVHGHDHVMKAGANGLAGHLGVELRDFVSSS
jgi:carbon monoxide dehydrogenase subunit G